MPISVTCDECFRDYSVPDRFAGRKVKCKGCGATMSVPDGVEVADEDVFDEAVPTTPIVGHPPGRRPAKPGHATKPADGNLFRSVGFWIAAVAGGVMIGIVVCCGAGVLWLRSAIDAGPVEIYANQPDHGDPTQPFPIAQIPLPQFPDLGTPKSIPGSEVQTFDVDLRSIPANDGFAGAQMTMRVYLPPGEHEPQSLPCVLVAPAGTDLLSGTSLDGGEYHDETLPYAEAGIAVVHYSLDGDVFDAGGESTAYLQFRAACAGVVNTRNALEFALGKLPMVDPARIYTAGHSSAGTLALLAAEHEPRLAGAIAYMPATDVEERLREFVSAPLMDAAFPLSEAFVVQSSPATHVAALAHPVFLFHAKGDLNVPFADSERFVEQLKAHGTDVTFVSVPGGNHYTPMITDGIPRAVEWLNGRTKR